MKSRAPFSLLRALRVVGTVLLAASLTSGCALQGPGVDPGEAGEPETGLCHALERPEQFEVLSDSAPAVPCTQPHTTETFMVTSAPTRYENVESRPGFDVRADIIAEVCLDTFLRVYLLAPQFQGLFGVWIVGFLPTEEAWRDGERWVRCDLVISEFDHRLSPIRVTGSLAGEMADENADEYAKCYQQDDAAASDGYALEGTPVRCTEPHTSRDVNNSFKTAAEPDQQVVLEGCTDAIFYYRGDGAAVEPEDVTAVAEEGDFNWVVRCAVVESDD